MRNLTLLTDLYQLTMMYAYHKQGRGDKEAVFDLFFRRNPSGNGFAIAAGLEQVIDYIQQLHFSEKEISYLKELGLFDQGFLELLRDFKFTGELYAIPEGTVVFPNEPLIRVKAPIMEAQLIETGMLNIINHQTLIATKASRVCQSAGEGSVLEFGLRRAQGPDAGIYGARAAVIGGCDATSNVLAGKKFRIPVRGTHGHSWIMSFPSELEAFRAYAEVFPDSCTLLVDTYDTLTSGVPNAIKVGLELRDKGYSLSGIRLDSGDLSYLSKTARKMLDEAGLYDTKIVASGDLDEHIIRDLKIQGAAIDIWGVGTNLITSSDCPALGGVYKLCAEEEGDTLVSKIKISDSIDKITNPGYKKVVRLYSNGTGKAVGDLIMYADEQLDCSKPLVMFDPIEIWKRKTVTNFKAKELLVPVFIDGKLVYDPPSLQEIQIYCQEDLGTFWDEYKRLKNPHGYHVDLSDQLYDAKQKLLKKAAEESLARS